MLNDSDDVYTTMGGGTDHRSNSFSPSRSNGSNNFGYQSQFEKKKPPTGLSNTPVSITRSKTQVYSPDEDIRHKVKKSASVNQHYATRTLSRKNSDEKIFKDIDGNIYRHGSSSSMTLPNSPAKQSQYKSQLGKMEEDDEYAPITSPTHKVNTSKIVHPKLPESPWVDNDYTDMEGNKDTVDGALPQKSHNNTSVKSNTSNHSFVSPMHKESTLDSFMTSRNSMESVSSDTRSSVSSANRVGVGRRDTRSPPIIVPPIVQVTLPEMDEENIEMFKTPGPMRQKKTVSLISDYALIPQPSSPSFSTTTQMTSLSANPDSAPNTPKLSSGNEQFVDVNLEAESNIEVIDEIKPRSMYGDNVSIQFSEADPKPRPFLNTKTVRFLVISFLIILGLIVGCVILALENQKQKERIIALEHQLADTILTTQKAVILNNTRNVDTTTIPLTTTINTASITTTTTIGQVQNTTAIVVVNNTMTLSQPPTSQTNAASTGTTNNPTSQLSSIAKQPTTVPMATTKLTTTQPTTTESSVTNETTTSRNTTQNATTSSIALATTTTAILTTQPSTTKAIGTTTALIQATQNSTTTSAKNNTTTTTKSVETTTVSNETTTQNVTTTTTARATTV